jgi:hypothetical protein
VSLRDIANRMRLQEAVRDLADALGAEHREEIARLDLAWWCVLVSLHGRFLGGIFVLAFGPIDAADEVRKRDLLDVATPYDLRFARVVKPPPVAVRFKLMNLEEMKLAEAEAERT